MLCTERSRYPSLRGGIVLLAVLASAVAFPGDRLGVGPRAVTYRVGVVGELPAGLEQMLDLPANVDVAFVAQPDRSSAEAAVRERTVAAAVADGEVLARSDASSPAVVLLRRALPRAAAVQRLAQAGVEPAEAGRVGAVGPAPVRVLLPASAGRKANTALAQAGAGATGFIVFLLFQFLVTGVQEERGRRMADVLLVTLRPLEVVAGKVLGIAALGLTILILAALPAAAVGVGFRGAHVVGQLALTAAAIPCWFALQCGFYGCVALTTGATAPSQDEAGLKGLVSAIVMALGSVVAAVVASAPDAPVSIVLSYLPVMAAPVMLVRAAAGHVAAWEVALSMVMLVASTAVMARVAARIYLGGVVRAGAKLNMRSAYRAGREGRAARASVGGGFALPVAARRWLPGALQVPDEEA